MVVPAAPDVPADLDIVFEADAVDLVRDGRLLLDQVSVAIRAGENWALLGPNGAGKSTLLLIMATYAYPSRGRVDVLGRRLGRVNVFELRPWIGHVSPHHQVDAHRTVEEVVLTGITGTIQLVQRRETSVEEVSRAAGLTELMGLADRADAPWQVLSQGERSRALIARALMAQPRLLLLDEPAAGLDVAGREQLLASLDDLRHRQPGLATVLVTHHLEELPATTTHALLLRAGWVLAAGPIGDVLTTELASACFGHPVRVSRHADRWAAVPRRRARSETGLPTTGRESA
ncbi:MAG TPA: ATP-binding cassette domain-containing protein [Streptosporangiaceae bacterium]|nr:ATP-binding cassette domain-containing protein [Streptosporangiaceae bacterium]